MKKLLLIMMVLLLSACDTTITEPVIEDPIIDDPVIDDPVVDELINGNVIDTINCTHLDNIGDWEPVWCDEFEYTGTPTSSKWTYDVGGSGWGNGEAQYYKSADEDNSYVDDGVLTITAIKEYFNGNSYTSARLVSTNEGNFTYGKIQVMAKLPGGRGTWPAIWMLPTDWVYGNWPHSGEIDIMEYVGYDPNIVHGTIHTGAYNHSLGTQVGESIVINTAETEFHLYEMDWEPGFIELFVDGVSYAVFEYNPEDNTTIANSEAWPFDEEFHLLMNIAVGGAWGGAQGIDDSIFPQELVVDYVRVYQKDYAGMDMSAPLEVTNLELLDSSRNSLYVTWDKAVDDVMVKEYEIYIDDTLFETTTVNGYLIEDLEPDTEYNIGIKSVDFVDNKSELVSLDFSTLATQSISERIEAEDYSLMNGIQLETTQDTEGSENVGWIDSGDFLEYVLKVEEAGIYQLNFRYASPNGNGAFDFSQDGNLLFNLELDYTGGWQSWANKSSNGVSLSIGEYTFRMDITESEFNFNYFEFTKIN